MADKKPPSSIADFQEVQAAEQDELLAFPNVVGVGLANKVTKGVDTGELCLSVFVAQKLTDPDDLPQGDKIRRTVAGVKTDVVETGEIFALPQMVESQPVAPIRALVARLGP